jgi:hypothetical protein
MGERLFIAKLKTIVAPDPEERARRELARILRREATYFAAVIRARLTRLNLCYRYQKNKKDWQSSKTQEVSFLRAVGTPEGIYLMVDTQRLPRGVRVSDLAEETILEDLAVACRRPVRFRYDIRCGAWYIVERASGSWGVPRRLEWGEVVERWPHHSRKRLLVPMGVGENRSLIYKSLADFPHALVGGATGAGKTTLLHAWISALAAHNPPADLRLVLIDLKGGVEFVRYGNLPHIVGPDLLGGEGEGDEETEKLTGYVKRQADVTPLLDWLRREMDRRLYRFERAGGIQNVDIWNYRRRAEQLPRLVLFVDELASLMLDPGLHKDTETILADITARGRAPGVHVVLSTQRPEVKVVSGMIKGNLDVRCAFRMTDNASSMVVLDTTEAARFDDTTPLGRYIYRRGIEKEELQGPLITPGQITELVRDVLSGGDGAESARIAPEDVFKLAVRQLGGSFSYRALYDALGGRASQDYLQRLGQELEGEVIEVDGELYEMTPGRGTLPRRLVPVGENEGNSHFTTHNAQEHDAVVEEIEGELVN